MENEAIAVPKTETENMVRIELRVPAAMLRDMLELAKEEGVKPGDLHRDLWKRGAAKYCEEANKRLVMRSLLRKQRSQQESVQE